MSDNKIKDEINKNKGKILNTLKTDNSYMSDIILIHKWEGEANQKNFLSKIKMGDTSFIGILDPDLCKNGYGYLSLPGNEKYFGIFTDDLKSKHGIYEYPDKLEGEIIEREFFFGLFKEGKINSHGVYLSIKENKNVKMFNDFDEANFSCFVGNLNEKHFIEGTHMTKEGDKYYVYHGKFNENNQKEGEGVFYYNSEKYQLMYGKAVKNKFVEGYLSVFDEDGNISNVTYVIFNENGTIKSFKKKQEMSDKKNIFDKMFDFRNKILEEDYFGNIFQIFKETMNVIENEVNFEAFDSNKQYHKIINVTYDFNKIKIKDEIEGVLAKYR